TYVNGSDVRVQSPYRLANGDRLKIGPYFVSVAVSGGAEAMPAAPQPMPQQHHDFPLPEGDIWSLGTAAPQPVDRRLFVEQRRGQRAPDVLDHFMDMPRGQPAAPYPPAQPLPGQPFAPAAPAWGAAPTAPSYPAAPPNFPPGPANAPLAPPPGFPPAPAPGGDFPRPQPTPFAPQQGYGAGQEMSASDFIAALAAAAGISPQALSGRPPED